VKVIKQDVYPSPFFLNHAMKKILALLCIVSLLGACDLKFRKNDERIKSLSQMQQTDVDFAQLASEQGYRKAFMQYMEDEAILLRDNYMPIIGADAVQYISSINDTSFRISWEPMGGDVSVSGDMGFTFGTYLLQTETEKQEGTYITVWRKQKDGTWKYVLDSGTQGLRPPVDSVGAAAE
jgi:ketosteroid isomerase-like protein